jgi:hypothetical protein
VNIHEVGKHEDNRKKICFLQCPHQENVVEHKIYCVMMGMVTMEMLLMMVIVSGEVVIMVTMETILIMVTMSMVMLLMMVTVTVGKLLITVM